MVVSLVVVPSANATNVVFDTAGNIVGSYVGPKSVVADWVFSGGASGGATATSAGNVTVPTRTGNISVPTTVNARYTAARVAGIAGKVFKAGTVVGAGFTAWEIYNAIKDSGVQVCPPPEFFCVPGEAPVSPAIHPDAKYDAAGVAGTFTSKEAAGAAAANWLYTSNGCTPASNPNQCPTQVFNCTEVWFSNQISGQYTQGHRIKTD